MGQGQFDGLLDLLNLLIQTTDVGVGLLWSFLQLHDCYHGICVVAQHTDDRVDLTDTTAGVGQREQTCEDL